MAETKIVGDRLTSPLDMNGKKITDLANGTASGDAVTFGQLKILQVVSATSTTAFSTTSSSFQTTNLSASITPSSTSSKVFILASANLRVDGTADVFATLARGGTNLFGSAGQTFGRGQSGTTAGANAFNTPATLSYLDSPSTTSPTTYAVQIRNTGGSVSVSWGDASVTQSIILAEVAG